MCQRISIWWGLIGVIFVCSAAEAGAQQAPAEKPSIEWKSEWRPFEASDLAVTLVGGAGTAVSNFALKQADEPRWERPILFDRAVGAALFSERQAGRSRGQTISDVGYFSLMIALPLVDASVSWLAHDDPYVAGQVFGTYAETFAITGLLASVIPLATARERPVYGDGCYSQPSRAGCRDRATISFPSGHTAMTFAGATAMIVQHSFLPLYGGRAGDAVGMTVAAGLAVTTGVGRIAAVKHHPTDVATGALLGAAVGFAVPYLLHYRFPDSKRRAVRLQTAPYVDGSSAGWRLRVEW